MDKDTVYPHLTECAAEAARTARGVTAEQLPAPSTCKEWEVRELVNHLVLYTSHGLEHRALREQLPEELTARDFTTDADWAYQYAAQLDRALAAWSEPAAWEGEVDLGSTTMPASEIASLIVKELAVHGWDLARSTGQEFKISDGTGEFVLAVVERHAEIYRQYDGFAAPQPVADDAPAFERALAASGRVVT
ncbi:TIGR03086 family protein [Streptomyces lunaelactis]|uniref:TIGR03086 family metal-binding protein n=1 Tax=Streptomyces lunaelactis TaxID=1535768 RepID=UPI0015850F27|nr:TIGR03086 family metal-binding protein [Streptomyces lunaelactis]NUK22190.1 TIGR03086 family protein [Streptomyces lunaelactis]NUK48786.1 TIGR03086 family protein [Streptomyces lunaelactis]NUK62567.1 TIGR03086 family protein [Streptomyces lunaelactis]NUK69546.1 TIGR03086 family protein [Streptomyces lunaelactis]NUK80269.1 TIGR03086 family protein [Streptomyces lunaelactis]